MEATCNVFMEPSSCNARKFCAYNNDDLKCESHELNTEGEYQDNHYTDCASQPQTACNDYAGHGTECGWNAAAGACERGYAGNTDFICMAYDSTTCATVGICMYTTEGCVSRLSHPGGIPEGNYDYSESESPTLKKPAPKASSKFTFDYRVGALVLFGLFLGFLMGFGMMHLFGKEVQAVDPVMLIDTTNRQV